MKEGGEREGRDSYSMISPSYHSSHDALSPCFKRTRYWTKSSSVKEGKYKPCIQEINSREMKILQNNVQRGK
jgi:hypothetical protein